MKLKQRVPAQDIVLKFADSWGSNNWTNCYPECQAGQESTMQSGEVQREPQVPEPKHFCQKQIKTDLSTYYNNYLQQSWVYTSVTAALFNIPDILYPKIFTNVMGAA